MLKVDGLTSGYGRVPVLRGIDLEVGPGECVGVLGRNGMGKTTLLRALMGELPAWSGSIMYQGINLSNAAPFKRARAGLGYVPQGKHIFASLTVSENLKMGCVKDLVDSDESIRRVLELFPRLLKLLDRPGGSLSGGEQQLLALARCLCGKPKLIFLDEPTEGIQPSICDEIVEVLLSLKQTSELSIMVVEQDIDFLFALCGRILAMNKGGFEDEIDPKAPDSDKAAKKIIGIEG